MGTIEGAGPPGTPAPWGVCANHNNRELFFRRAGTAEYRPALLARHPNVFANGSWNWAGVAAPCSADNITTNLSAAQLQRWSAEQHAWRGSGGLWLQTYFEWDWANALVRVDKVLPSSRQLTIDPNTSSAHMPVPGNRWLAVNALSELDDTNEYYLDRERALAYFLPPPDADEIVLSGAASIIEASALTNVVMEGLSMQFAR